MKRELFLSVHKPQAKFTWSPLKSVLPWFALKSRDSFLKITYFSDVANLPKYQKTMQTKAAVCFLSTMSSL